MAKVKMLTNLSNDDYHSKPEWSSSQLKVAYNNIALFKKKYIDKTIPREHKKAFTLGTLFHEMVLEPEVFDPVIFPLAPTIDRRLKLWKDWVKENPDINLDLVISQQERDVLDKMYESYLSHPEASKLIEGNVNEMSVFFEYREEELRIRPDSYKAEGRIIPDLKTTAFDVDPLTFKRKMRDLGYDISAAQYVTGMNKAVGEPHAWCWIVTQTVEPYSTVVYWMTEDIYLEGMRKFDESITAIQRARVEGYQLQSRSELLSYSPITSNEDEVNLHFPV